jgi:hypothetical protein
MSPNVPFDGSSSTDRQQKRQSLDTNPLSVPYSAECLPSDDSADALGETAGERRQCPLCGFASRDRNDVYVHLMAAHRKSRLSDALLTRARSDHERPVPTNHE